MSSADAPSSRDPLADYDICLFVGGPLFQMLRRAHLEDDALGLVRRRIVAFILVTWAPLLIFSAFQGGFIGGDKTVGFLKDIECHVRFLIVVPLLIYAELFVHRRLRASVGQFTARDLIRPRDMPRFDKAIGGILRLRNSIIAEILLISLVYFVGIFIVWRQYTALQLNSWYALPSGSGRHLSLAGYWYAFVSLPFFQFLLLRWYFRLFIWARFLWSVAKLDLDLDAIHPDRAGGLGFLSATLRAYVPLALAHGALLASWIANRIFYAGAKLSDFLMEVFFLVVFLLFLFAGPLLAFTPMLEQLQRTTLGRLGGLGQTYVRDFDAKWFGGSASVDEQLLGSTDIQFLADLRNSYAIAEETRITPFSRRALVEIIFAVLAPIAPLVLTLVPAEKIIGRLFGMVF